MYQTDELKDNFIQKNLGSVERVCFAELINKQFMQIGDQ